MHIQKNVKLYYFIFNAVFYRSLCGLSLSGQKTLVKTKEEPGKDIPAESGHLHKKPVWGRYHVHYYGYALLFLAFDMEMAYMYPWAVVYKKLGITALMDMGVFLLILFLGLLYTWSQGGLKRQ